MEDAVSGNVVKLEGNQPLQYWSKIHSRRNFKSYLGRQASFAPRSDTSSGKKKKLCPMARVSREVQVLNAPYSCLTIDLSPTNLNQVRSRFLNF